MLSDQKKTDSIFFKRNSCRHFTPFVLLKDHIYLLLTQEE